jgi:hypothetical protein
MPVSSDTTLVEPLYAILDHVVLSQEQEAVNLIEDAANLLHLLVHQTLPTLLT